MTVINKCLGSNKLILILLLTNITVLVTTKHLQMTLINSVYVINWYLMSITTNSKPGVSHYQLFLKGVKSTKYLVMTVSFILNWGDHINNTAAKASKAFGTTKCILNSCTQQVNEIVHAMLV